MANTILSQLRCDPGHPVADKTGAFISQRVNLYRYCLHITPVMEAVGIERGELLTLICFAQARCSCSVRGAFSSLSVMDQNGVVDLQVYAIGR